MDLSPTSGTLDDDEVAVPCRQFGCRLDQYLVMGSGTKMLTRKDVKHG